MASAWPVPYSLFPIPCFWGVHTKVPRAQFRPESPSRARIIKDALRLFARSFGSLAADSRAAMSGSAQAMKPISHRSIAHAKPPPERVSRAVAAAGLACCFCSRSPPGTPSDPSLNTSTDTGRAPRRPQLGRPVRRLAQRPAAATLGITAFFLPLWLGGLGWTWMHSRPSGSPWLRWTGTLLALHFRAQPSSACCRGTGAGCMCCRLRASSAGSCPRCWSATSTFRARGWSPACSPQPASTSPPPSASGLFKESIEERWIHAVSPA